MSHLSIMHRLISSPVIWQFGSNTNFAIYLVHTV